MQNDELRRALGHSTFNILHSAFCILLSVAACNREPPRPPNVLLITLDTLRADHVGAYGSRAGSTPAIDSIAARGARFEHAGSAVPLTLPSHATILSGLLPLHHGLRNNGAGSFPSGRPTLATLFSEKGYRTAAFLGAFVLDRRFGLNRGFDVYDDEIPRDPTLGDHLEAERRGDAVADRAAAWLARPDSRPFFAWVHLYDAHAPYTPPEPFRTRYAASAYDGEIAFVDQQIGRLLAVLQQSGQRDHTIIVVTGDHGEALGEHGELTHGLLLYEGTLRVPLIIEAPGTLDPHVVTTPVSLADIAPTVAGLAKVPMTSSTPLDGRDLSPPLLAKREPEARNIYAETEYPTVFGWSPLAALRNGTHKFIAAPTPQLFDLSRDPQESRNVLTDERRVMRALSDSLSALQATATAPGQSNAQPDAETMAKLASLGYVGGMPPSRGGAAGPDPNIMVPLFRRFEEATWALTAKNYDQAAATLEALVREDPRNPVFRGSLAKAERLRGRPQRAIALYRDAIVFAPQDAQAWYNLAAAFQESGDLPHAAEAVREALRRDEHSADAHNVLGIIHSEEGEPGAAFDEFRKAVAIDPRNARIHNNIGNAARATGRLDEAEAEFRRAIALAPNYPDPFNGLGALDIDRNRFAEAIRNFDRALELAPGYHEARLNRAVALQLSGNLAGAEAEYSAFLARSEGGEGFERQRAFARDMLRKLGAARTK
jgi:choline-sulfatase